MLLACDNNSVNFFVSLQAKLVTSGYCMSNAMTSIHDKRVDPQKYYRGILSQGVRPDGRGFDEFRNMSINIKSLCNADGSAVVKIGNTAVVCGVKAELSKPKAETPDHGYLVTNIELLPLCSSLYQPGPPSDYAQEASRFLDETLKNCSCIDLKELCIIPNVLAWVLHLDIICINQDGSLLDACIVAALATLKVVTLPEVLYNAETKIKEINPEVKRTLTINKFPVATTFAVFENNCILMDPTSEEELLSSGTVTAVVEAYSGKFCGMHQPGTDPISPSDLQKCITEAQKKTKSVEELVRLALGKPDR